MGVLVTVQVGQDVKESVEGPFEKKTLVSANYPTTTIEIQRIVVYEQGAPIYKTVIPETWSVCSKSTGKPLEIKDPTDPSGKRTIPADKLKVVPVKSDTANGLRQVAADNKDKDTWSILDSKKVATGLAFKDQSLISNADAAGAATVGQQLVNNVHHLDNVSKYYDAGTYDQNKLASSGNYMKNPDGSYKRDPVNGWYMIDGTSYGSDIRNATVLDDRSRITQNAYTEVKPFANIEVGWRNSTDTGGSASGLLPDPAKKLDKLPDILGSKLTEDPSFADGVNKYVTPNPDPKKPPLSDIAVASGGFTAKILIDPKIITQTSADAAHKDYADKTVISIVKK